MTQVVSAKQFRENFSEILNEVAYGEEKILITRNGKSQAMLVGIKDLNPKDFVPKEEWNKTFRLIRKVRSRGKNLSKTQVAKILNQEIQAVRKQRYLH